MDACVLWLGFKGILMGRRRISLAVEIVNVLRIHTFILLCHVFVG
jgi:hypothetical protein